MAGVLLRCDRASAGGETAAATILTRLTRHLVSLLERQSTHLSGSPSESLSLFHAEIHQECMQDATEESLFPITAGNEK